MELSKYDRATLTVAAEGISGLWDVVWELEALGVERGEALNRGRASVRRLLHEGLVEIYSRTGPLEDEVALSMEEAEKALETDAHWVPPDGDRPATMIGATDSGTMAFVGCGGQEPGVAE